MLIRSIIFTVSMLLAVMACLKSPAILQGDEAGVVMQFPEHVEGYYYRKGEPDPIELKMLPSDTEFAKATYYSSVTDPAASDQVSFSIVLSGAERKSIHRPEVCLVGQGWTLLDNKVIPIALPDGGTLRVSDLYIEKVVVLPDGTKRPLRAHYLYWFVGNDVSTPSHFQRIRLSMWDNIARNVNHRWAYISALAYVTEEFSPAETGQRQRSSAETLDLLSNLLRDVVPKVQKEYIAAKS